MKINLNKQEYSRCAEILDVKEHNIVSAEIYIEYLNNHYNDIVFAKDEKSKALAVKTSPAPSQSEAVNIGVCT